MDELGEAAICARLEAVGSARLGMELGLEQTKEWFEKGLDCAKFKGQVDLAC